MATSPRSPAPSGTESALLITLILALIGLTFWSCSKILARRRQRPWQESALLPKPRLGATPHERLQDAKYLSLILQEELKSSRQAQGQEQAQEQAQEQGQGQGQGQGQQSSSAFSRATDAATSPEDEVSDSPQGSPEPPQG